MAAGAPDTAAEAGAHPFLFPCPPFSPRRKQSALEIKNREEAAQRAAAIEAAEPEDASAASHYLSNREALRAAKAVEHELLQSEAASAIQRRVRQRTQRRLGVV
jgi:hypothetical protein